MRDVTSRLLRSAAFVLALLAPIPPAGAFMTAYSITNGAATFTFSIEGNPQWTLDTGSGVYRGQVFDSARFDGTFGLSFDETDSITLDNNPVQARLKGKIGTGPDCSTAKITLTDATNHQKLTLSEPFTGPGFMRSCT